MLLDPDKVDNGPRKGAIDWIKINLFLYGPLLSGLECLPQLQGFFVSFPVTKVCCTVSTVGGKYLSVLYSWNTAMLSAISYVLPLTEFTDVHAQLNFSIRRSALALDLFSAFILSLSA